MRLPKPREFHVDPPPENCSNETEAEIAELKEFARLRTEADLAQIWRWSTDEESPLSHWNEELDDSCRRYKLSAPAAARVHVALAEAIYRSFIACWQEKWRYLRPRPTDLDATLPTAIPVPRHPSYPSGHSTVAGAASAILAHFFPAEAERWQAMAQEAGIARLKAGIHYRSDHTAGLALGSEIAQEILAGLAKDGGPQEYHP
jgi:membrane-associated phospholipid phosphatase